MWVGQVDHVIFIQGSQLNDMSIVIKSSDAPIPDSAIQMPSSDMGDVSEGGNVTVVWLAGNGYVAGSSSGQLIEYQASHIDNISANTGTTVSLGGRLLTAVN